MSLTSSIINREIEKVNEQLQSKMMLRVNNQVSFNQSLIKETSSKHSIYIRAKQVKEKDNRRAAGGKRQNQTGNIYKGCHHRKLQQSLFQ